MRRTGNNYSGPRWAYAVPKGTIEGSSKAATTFPGVPLATEMRVALERAGELVRTATSERDQLIRQALGEGGSLREIGEAVGLSHTAVKLIGEKGG